MKGVRKLAQSFKKDLADELTEGDRARARSDPSRYGKIYDKPKASQPKAQPARKAKAAAKPAGGGGRSSAPLPPRRPKAASSAPLPPRRPPSDTGISNTSPLEQAFLSEIQGPPAPFQGPPDLGARDPGESMYPTAPQGPPFIPGTPPMGLDAGIPQQPLGPPAPPPGPPAPIPFMANAQPRPGISTPGEMPPPPGPAMPPAGLPGPMEGPYAPPPGPPMPPALPPPPPSMGPADAAGGITAGPPDGILGEAGIMDYLRRIGILPKQ